VTHQYSFRPLTTGDLPLMQTWLGAPHMRRWWGDAEPALAELRQAIEEPSTDPFLVLIEGRPGGYIQSYDIHAEPDHPYRDQPPGSIGIDLSLGEADLLGAGHGPRIIEAFVARLFAAGVPRIVIDPAPDNERAIRAYEKAHFRIADRRTTSEYGDAVLMVRDK
jgi:aminoglycoside 6'-N-acetyltransferase